MIINYKRYRNNHCRNCARYVDSNLKFEQCQGEVEEIIKCARGKLKEIFRSEFGANFEY